MTLLRLVVDVLVSRTYTSPGEPATTPMDGSLPRPALREHSGGDVADSRQEAARHSTAAGESAAQPGAQAMREQFQLSSYGRLSVRNQRLFLNRRGEVLTAARFGSLRGFCAIATMGTGEVRVLTASRGQLPGSGGPSAGAAGGLAQTLPVSGEPSAETSLLPQRAISGESGDGGSLVATGGVRAAGSHNRADGAEQRRRQQTQQEEPEGEDLAVALKCGGPDTVVTCLAWVEGADKLV